jgi:hypothetical protein
MHCMYGSDVHIRGDMPWVEQRLCRLFEKSKDHYTEASRLSSWYLFFRANTLGSSTK